MIQGHYLIFLFDVSEFGDAVAVSYTHLDVYKRQLPHCANKILQTMYNQ